MGWAAGWLAGWLLVVVSGRGTHSPWSVARRRAVLRISRLAAGAGGVVEVRVEYEWCEGVRGEDRDFIAAYAASGVEGGAEDCSRVRDTNDYLDFAFLDEPGAASGAVELRLSLAAGQSLEQVVLCLVNECGAVLAASRPAVPALDAVLVEDLTSIRCFQVAAAGAAAAAVVV